MTSTNQTMTDQPDLFKIILMLITDQLLLVRLACWLMFSFNFTYYDPI